jgi:hypothetical protein
MLWQSDAARGRPFGLIREVSPLQSIGDEHTRSALSGRGGGEDLSEKLHNVYKMHSTNVIVHRDELTPPLEHVLHSVTDHWYIDQQSYRIQITNM